MRRLLYSKLIEWKNKSNRKPLLLQGARQVGKTYLLKEFGSKEYEDLAYFDFEESPELISIFKSTLNPNILIETLSAYIGRKIKTTTLIFFDEIQVLPSAITSLKYFYEKAPNYHIVSAGSLLGINIGKSYNFPVGKVNFLTLYSMSFFEYLSAINEDILLTKIFNKNDYEKLPEILHEKLLRLYKFYLFVGGMPEVVKNYLNNKDIEEVRNIQNDILNAYRRDFSKYSTSNEAIRISEFWNSIPVQLSKENKKFKYSEIQKGGRSSKFEFAKEWLKNTGLIHIIYNLKKPKLPLKGYTDFSKFKIYFHDTGLLGAMLDLSSETIVNKDKIFSEYNGAFIENFVAIELIKNFDFLNYWTSRGEAEVDFVVKIKDDIFPIEVKSGLSRKTKSLRVYAEKYLPSILFRTSPRNFTKNNDLINIPLYAISLITKNFNWK